ncbi:hypothetical protein MMC25_008349 [Agyrium rufum]|nr:hypothetical protein [Agyrium rufum]
MPGFANTSDITHGAKVPQIRFNALIWGAVATTFLFVACRLVIRMKVFRRLFSDDIFVVLSWLFFLANVILYQEMTDTIYLTINVFAGLEAPPADILQRTLVFLHEELAANLLFLASIWSIKISFLLFFKKLGNNVSKQYALWWIVFWGTLIGFVISLATTEYRCTTAQKAATVLTCATPAAVERTRRSLQVTTAFDIITDVMILAIPINLLWNVRISIRQRLILIGVFSLTLFTMAVSLARVIVLLNESDQIDISFLFTWFVVEQAVSIVVACIASYRALFAREAKSQHRGAKTLIGSDERSGSIPMNKFSSVTVVNSKFSNTVYSNPVSSTDHILPDQSVHVKREYSVLPDEKTRV